MNNISIFKHFIHRAVHNKLVVMMINCGTNDFRLFFICQSEIPKNLPRKCRSFMRVIIIRS